MHEGASPSGKVQSPQYLATLPLAVSTNRPAATDAIPVFTAVDDGKTPAERIQARLYQIFLPAAKALDKPFGPKAISVCLHPPTKPTAYEREHGTCYITVDLSGTPFAEYANEIKNLFPSFVTVEEDRIRFYENPERYLQKLDVRKMQQRLATELQFCTGTESMVGALNTAAESLMLAN